MRMRKSVQYAARLLTIVIVLAGASSTSMLHESMTAYGIWAHENTVLVFTLLHGCDGPYLPQQPLVSRDGGKSWNASGPRLLGDDFEYILDTGKDLWIAGEGYAEGPAHDPFLLLVGSDNADWPQFDIYDGGAELMGIAFEVKSGRFLAWVRHLNLSDDDSTGPIYLHQSIDQGRTWTAVKEVKRVPTSAPGLRFFQELPEQSGPWRISAAGEFKSVVEHRRTDGTWHRVSELPPQPCPSEEARNTMPAKSR